MVNFDLVWIGRGLAMLFDEFLLVLFSQMTWHGDGSVLTLTRLMSPSPAATQIFFSGRVDVGMAMALGEVKV